MKQKQIFTPSSFVLERGFQNTRCSGPGWGCLAPATFSFKSRIGGADVVEQGFNLLPGSSLNNGISYRGEF